jgi:hypothetical protein
MEFKIIKRINANSVIEALRREAAGEVVAIEIFKEEDYNNQVDKRIGYAE